jgi:hypothetical protein
VDAAALFVMLGAARVQVDKAYGHYGERRRPRHWCRCFLHERFDANSLAGWTSPNRSERTTDQVPHLTIWRCPCDLPILRGR